MLYQPLSPVGANLLAKPLLRPTLHKPIRREACGPAPIVLAEALDDEVNLALWQRQLPAHIADFGALLLSLNEPLAESLSLEFDTEDAEPNLRGLASGFWLQRSAGLRWLYRRCRLAGQRLCLPAGRQARRPAPAGVG